MYWMKHQSHQENIIYLVVWGLLFAAPLLSFYIRTVSVPNMVFDWTEVFLVWRQFAVFLLLFLIHNYLLAPLLVHEHKHVLYLSFVAILFVGFTIFQCSRRPNIEGPSGPHPQSSAQHEHIPPPPHDAPPPHHFRPDAPPPITGERDILAAVVLILMFGANLGTKYYFRSRDDQQRLADLEKKNLEQQLEYLRYQINPHFFMNTLNNIHALVDINPAKAQVTILEMSKMMRYLLYESDKNGVPLQREFEFLHTYISLMQLRYTDKVRISVDLPAEVPNKTIPPLILISYVENAFKHGISYQHDSLIEVKAEVKAERLRFTCHNSKASKEEESGKKGGIGLANVRKRLNLLYGNDYSLTIQDTTETYTVELVIPLYDKS